MRMVFKIAAGRTGAKAGGRGCAGVAGLACPPDARLVIWGVSSRLRAVRATGEGEHDNGRIPEGDAGEQSR